MTSRRKTIPKVLLALAAALSLASCLGVRGPGIMPPVEDVQSGQWQVTSSGFIPVRKVAGEEVRQWHILARFLVEKDREPLRAEDLKASVDGKPQPFTFQEREQLFESVVSGPLDPGAHHFILGPAPETTRRFPTLSIDFTVP